METRFKYLALVLFCNKYGGILERRNSTAFNLNYEWMVFFDDGRFVLREWNGSIRHSYSQDIRGVLPISQ